MVRRTTRHLRCIVVLSFISWGIALLTACVGVTEAPAENAAPETLLEISVTAGEQTFQGVLYDNETARAVADLLPLDVDLWNPAPGFAKAFQLQESIPDTGSRTRSYELGGLAYWFEGPSVAIFYSDHLAETIVPVVPVGKLQGDVSALADYDAVIRIEVMEEDRARTS